MIIKNTRNPFKTIGLFKTVKKGSLKMKFGKIIPHMLTIKNSQVQQSFSDYVSWYAGFDAITRNGRKMIHKLTVNYLIQAYNKLIFKF